MKPSLNSSLVSSSGLESYLDTAKQAGYRWVDVSAHQLQQEVAQKGLAAVEELFHSRGLQASNFGLPVNVNGTEAEFRDGLAQLPDLAEIAVYFGATRCCTWLWPSIDEQPVPYASRLAKRFRQCADVLAAYGVRLGLEFVGPHHLRGRRYPFLYTMQDTLGFIDAIGAPNMGLLLDSYHWYTTGGTFADIAALSAKDIVHVHVNDTDKSPEEAVDNERLLPGEGKIDLHGFFKALRQVRYNGPVSIEVLHKEPFGRPDLEVAQTALESVCRFIREAGATVS